MRPIIHGRREMAVLSSATGSGMRSYEIGRTSCLSNCNEGKNDEWNEQI